MNFSSKNTGIHALKTPPKSNKLTEFCPWSVKKQKKSNDRHHPMIPKFKLLNPQNKGKKMYKRHHFEFQT